MKIILVNYDFPPNDGIGGRRWAKLAKALALNGHELWVIKAEALPGLDHSPWTKDVDSPNIHIHNVPRKYPNALQKSVRTLWDKVRYRWARNQLQKSVKGTIYDISIGWSSGMNQAVKDIAKTQQIQWIIATGAPWNMLFDLACLVPEFPSLRLLVDFRDPWINARNYGMADLSTERLAWEKHKQFTVLTNAHIVTSPYPHLTNELRAFAPQSAARFEVLSHFFDQDDIPALKPNDHSDLIRIMYAGEMYVECDAQLQWLSGMLTQLRSNLPVVYERLRIDFYSPTNRQQFFVDHPHVCFHQPIGKDIFDKLNEADGLILLLTDSKKHDLTTKFFEYLPFHKPLLAMGAAGGVTQFVEVQELGLVWTSELNVNDWGSQLLNLKSPRRTDLPSYASYELKRVAAQLIELLQ